MAYADYMFYKDKYFGNIVPESDFTRISSRASDFVDVMTFDRLAAGFPSDERAAEKVKKAVCAVSEKMYELELAEKQALAAAKGGSSAFGGANPGIVASRSAGGESISYASPSEMARGASAWSATYSAAGNPKEANKILFDTAAPYLTGVRNDKGVHLLYAGL